MQSGLYAINDGMLRRSPKRPVRLAAGLTGDLTELVRPESLGPFDFTVVSPTNRLDLRVVDGYHPLGVDRLIVLPGLDVPPERRYHPCPIEEILRHTDHLAELADG